MRFAYIDSNGNEVPIPSVDALALRIELGAINEETELYDAQADQWGPAHTHEIFHTLSRAAEDGDQGFVAPLPPMPPPPPQQEATVEADPEAAAPGFGETDDTGLELAEPAAEETPEEAHDPGLTLADSAPAEEEVTSSLDLEFSPTVPDELSTMADELPADPADGLSLAGEQEDEGAAFDFGDLSGGLEMEGFGADDAEPAMDFSMGADDGGGFGTGLEQEMEFSTAGIGGAEPSASLDLEQPMSDFSPEDPPAWMEPDEVADSGGDVMDFSSLASDTVAPVEVEGDPRQRRAPKDKPSAPRFRRQRALVGPIVGIVVLAAVGVGAYVAWPIVRAQIANRGLPAEVEEALPTIPDELIPELTAAADAALADVFGAARAGVGAGPNRPPENWLAGRYFGDASQFQGVEAFWLGIQDQLDAVRAIDGEAFHAAYERAMATQGVAEANRARLLERADAGFVAAARPRAEVLALVDELALAALELHSFLVVNEDNIEYAPAASTTGFEVLEARPSTPEIGDAMRNRIDRVTSALDGLDYLGEVVTTEGLWAAVLARVQEVGFQ